MMKITKIFIYFAVYIVVLIADYLSSHSLALVLLVTMIILFMIDEILSKKIESEQSLENKQLQKIIQSNSKDAHIKNKQLLTMVSSIPWPMILLDQQGQIVMHNDLTVVSKIKNKLVHSSYMQNDLDKEVAEFVKDCFILEKELDKMIKIHNIEYQVLSIPILAKGKYRGCLILFQDISKALEKEKMQKRFIADASHELKTPIAVIKGMVEILNRDDFDDEETQKEFLFQIEQEVNRIDLLVKDLLVLSRLSNSDFSLDLNYCDMNAILERSIRSLKKALHDKGLKIEKNIQIDRFILCDEQKMEQVFINLISNAIKYSDQGVISINATSDEHQVKITVSDQGVGIRQENIEKIFERFYREDDARSRLSGGSGLGLSIVKSICDAHKAKIEVVSKVNEGSSFTIIMNDHNISDQ